ncbi:MAG: hypothetical protein M1821_004012 [Bathelium mastoideum]|nr:MAG: hypothetical protein M1821_004012 [Bathelium mastoideum]
MLSRALIRGRVVRPFLARAALNPESRVSWGFKLTPQPRAASNKRAAIEVVAYNQGSRHQKTLNVEAGSAGEAPSDEPLQPASTSDTWTVKSPPPTMGKFALGGKTAVVTGGARGLGREMAEGLLDAGLSRLVLMDQNQELGEKAAAALSAKTSAAIRFYKLDVRDEAAAKKAVDDAVSHLGVPQILINAAGIAESNIDAADYDIEKFTRQININLVGTFIMAKTVANAMVKAKSGGSMVFIASMSGSIVNWPQNQCCYNASKAGVIQLAKSLSTEWARANIRVNCISPGYMDTELNRVPALEGQKNVWINMTPQKRLGNVDELNGLAVFLASDASSFMTGANVIIDGGYTAW